MLKNKIVLITGSTDGIGKQTAFRMANQSAVVLLHGKNPVKGEQVRQEIVRKTDNQNIHYFNADFTFFSEINLFADTIGMQFNHIDVLINNAGIYDREKSILENGIEKNFMVNHLAGFALTLKLLELLKQAPEARIINVSSMIHADSIDFENLNAQKHYSGNNAYSVSKLCNILFTYELCHRLKDTTITVNAVHPGVINTKLLRAGWGNMGDNPEQGANRLLYLADAPEVSRTNCKYFMHDRPTRSADISYNRNVAGKLWDVSLEYIQNGSFC